MDEVRTFKPSPEVYELLMQKSGSPKERTWMVSANAFDVIGAASVGLQTIWLKRNPDAVFDPFGITYNRVVNSLVEIIETTA